VSSNGERFLVQNAKRQEARMSERTEKANEIIRRYSYWSAGFGLIPLPIVDVAVITGTQIKMVRELSKIYDRENSEDMVRASIGTQLAAALPVALGSGTVSALKTVPVLGQIAGTLLLPALALASTVAVGRVFVHHSEAGGTLLDFDPAKMRAYFEAEFNKAKTGSDAEMATAPSSGADAKTAVAASA
jgi:uncharacterized protein (DUF697 family)